VIEADCTAEELAEVLADNLAAYIETSVKLLGPIVTDEALAHLRNLITADRPTLVRSLEMILSPATPDPEGPRW